MGLAYIASNATLVVSDSEVDETGLYHNVNIWLTSADLGPTSAFGTGRYTVEPADVAAGRGGRTLFLCDDTLDRVFTVRAGPDERWGTKDDRVTSFPTDSFGSADPEGLGYGHGSLFLTDGNNRAVYRLKPGRDGRFDGARPAGDDVVTTFHTHSLGLEDPEDVAYDRASGHLFLISRVDRTLIEATPKGHLVAAVDLSSSGIRFPSGVAVTRPANDPDTLHVYVADRGIDNNAHQGGDPNENDGRIFEFAFARPPDTEPPAAPTGLTVSSGATGMALDWDDSPEPDLAGYNVYREDGAGAWALIASLEAATSAYTDPSPASPSTYRVTAVDIWGNESAPAEAGTP
jgi:hypothetical protein